MSSGAFYNPATEQYRYPRFSTLGVYVCRYKRTNFDNLCEKNSPWQKLVKSGSLDRVSPPPSSSIDIPIPPMRSTTELCLEGKKKIKNKKKQKRRLIP